MTRDTGYCFGADLGGTKLAAAIADARGSIVAELTEPTDPRGAAYVAEQIAACAEKLAKTVGIEATQARHVMVGIPGAIDPRTGRVSLTPNIAGLEDYDVLGYLRGRFGPDVAIENDVNLAMLGEHALGSAGEIADLPIGRDPTSQLPSAGGTFELEVGSLAIVDRYRREGGTAAATVRDIFRLLEQGDEVAASVLDTTARWVALAVVTLQSLLDLELIVFGGSIGVRPELYERVRTVLPALFSRPINIAPSRLGDRAGLIGAAWAAGQALRLNPEPARVVSARSAVSPH